MPRRPRRSSRARVSARAKPRTPASLPPPSDTVLDLIAEYAGGGPALDASSPVVDGWLAYFERKYHETHNPIFAWEAIGLAIGGERPMPLWLVAYLTRVAAQMHAMSRETIPEQELPPAIARALEFPTARGVNPFRTITDTAHDLLIAFEVLEEIRGGKKPDFAVIDVARDHAVSRSTVERCWKRYRSRFDRLPGDEW